MPVGDRPQDSLSLELASEEATLRLGRQLGRRLAAGAVVLLEGGLGAGKTVLARGLARGLGVAADYAIVSPTFTLLNIYPGRLGFYHADLYRLEAEQTAELELLEEAADGVLAVEWAERAPGQWPADSLRIELVITGPQSRRALLQGPAGLLASLQEGAREAPET